MSVFILLYVYIWGTAFFFVVAFYYFVHNVVSSPNTPPRTDSTADTFCDDKTFVDRVIYYYSVHIVLSSQNTSTVESLCVLVL